MRNLFIMLSCVCVLLAGCSSDSDNGPEIPEIPQPELKLTANDPSVTVDENGLGATIAVDKEAVSVTIEVTTNLDNWTLSQGIPDWIETVPSENSLDVKIKENKAVGGRHAEFKISVQNESGSLEATVKVSQAGVAEATLDLSDDELSIPDAGGSVEVSFTTNQPTVNVENKEGWLTFSQSSDKITFTAGANDTGTLRTAEVTVTAGGGDNTATETVVIRQDTRTTLTISNKNVTILPEGGSEEVTISSNHQKIEIAIEDEWLSYTKTDNLFTFTAEANGTGALRTTEVVVTAGEGEKTVTDKIVVVQNPLIKSLRYVIKTTTDNREVGLPTLKSDDAAISIKVDYGDGSAEETFEVSLAPANKHTFASAGEYIVTILTDNVISSFSFNGNTYLYKVENNSLDMSGVKTLARSFYNCIALTEVAANTVSPCVNATNGEYLFNNCKALTAIPSGLLSSLTKVTTFNNAFQNCSALSSIPAGLFEGLTTVQTVNSTFMGSAVTEVPSRLFAGCTSVTKFSYTFNSCKKLTSIAADAFEGCTKVTEFFAVFTECETLASIPAGIFSQMTSLSSIEYCFQSCKGLTSLPASLFDNNRNLRNYEYAFMNCTGLTGESPYTMINSQKVHLYERANYPEDFQSPSGYDGCFRNAELLTDYSAIVQNGWAN